MRQFDESRARAEAALADWHDPHNWAFQSDFGDCYMSRGAYRKAVQAYENALSASENDLDDDMRATIKVKLAKALRNVGYNRAEVQALVNERRIATYTPEPDAATSFRRAGWPMDRYTVAQIEVMIDHGATPHNITPGLPCHVSRFTSGMEYHSVTWWYCDENGRWIQAYEFVNGQLENEYRP